MLRSGLWGTGVRKKSSFSPEKTCTQEQQCFLQCLQCLMSLETEAGDQGLEEKKIRGDGFNSGLVLHAEARFSVWGTVLVVLNLFTIDIS